MPPVPKWVSVAAVVDRRGLLRVLAVDDKGQLWLLWTEDDVKNHPKNTWLSVLPPHP